MSLDFSSVRYMQNGETLDQEFINRPLRDLIAILRAQIPNNYYTKSEVDAMIQQQQSEDALIYALIFGGK